MLSPEQLEAAGDAVAAVYNDIEARMLDHLVSSLISIDRLDQRTITELNLLAQSHTAQLRGYIEDRAGQIDEEVRATAERLLRASDEDDIRRAGEGSPMWPQQVGATVEGVARILARDNLQMVEGAKQAFLGASIEAVTRVNAGAMTTERALHSAVRKLEREGVPIVTYQNSATGTVTVRNKVDVAVRRHIRTQVAQDGASLTMERMERLGIDLVEVSSHEDSRPSHAEWQGRCYSLKGEQVIDGVRYPDFYEETRYGQVDGLLGANCRHSFGPYRHGAPRMYDPDPQHPSGLPGSEVYELEQQQRYRERLIREAKRELRGAQMLYDADPSLPNLTNLNKAKNLLKARQGAMRDYIEGANAKGNGKPVLRRHPNREWAGDMPKITTSVGIASETKVTRKEHGGGYSEEYAVKRRVVNGAAYKARFSALGVPKRAAQTLHQQAMRILEDRDGTPGERLCAISWRNGTLLKDTFGRAPVNFASGFTTEEVEELSRVPGGVIFLHNHPGSSIPSATDITTLAENDWVRASVVVCHDGTIYVPKVLNNKVSEAYNAIVSSIKEQHPEITDSKEIESMAQDYLYDENGRRKWFKIMKP